MKNLLSLLLVLVALPVAAQLPDTLYLRFASNDATLSPASVKTLDSLKTSLLNVPQAYALRITGHTDNDGNDAFNLALSSRRTETTAAWFRKAGFLPKNMQLASKGLRQPEAENADESGKAMNRRVQIIVSLAPVDVEKGLGLKLKPEEFTFDTRKGGTFTTESGSVIRIPAGALIDSNGNRITGNVTMRYQEYRDPADFILGGIPMTTKQNGEYYAFNSAGMFKLDLLSGDKPLTVSADTSIAVDFKYEKNLPDVGLFNYDTTQQHWAQVAQANQLHAQTYQVNNGQSPVEYVKGKRTCRMNACACKDMTVTFGRIFADNYIPLNLDSIEETFALLQEVRAKNKVPPSIVYYAEVKKLRRERYAIRFNASPDLRVTRSIAGIRWIVDEKKYGLPPDSLCRNITITPPTLPGYDWSITMTRRDGETQIGAQPKMKRSARRLMTPETAVTLFESAKAHQKKIDGSANIYMSGRQKSFFVDSLFCFYSSSKAWMEKNTKEDSLSFRRWLMYFEDHPQQMSARYRNIAENPDPLTRACIEQMSEQRRIDSLKAMALMQSEAMTAGVGNVMTSLSIKAPGVWNCDQLDRLQDPAVVTATYTDTLGKPLTIVASYLIDERINGALVYDGSMQYGPNYFPYDPDSRNTLIAFDLYGKAYIYNSKAFSDLSKTVPEEYTFKMQPITNIGSKSELRSLLQP